ncbi:hypothetical protein B0H12DRAFT_1125258 [Mycena haematopus]|nr:hypothetical protein B0H12DRAFT_1125258 [Mycena haematopus]
MAYPFVLSQRSISQERNMFLFSFRQYPFVLMAGGWNLKYHRMMIQTFYRWRFDVLSYIVDSVEGTMLPRDSVELMEPGVYGPFIDDQPYRLPVGHRFEVSTLRAMERDAQLMGEGVVSENKMPQDVVDAVTMRDGGVCCFTGRADLPTSIIWVFPPTNFIVYFDN